MAKWLAVLGLGGCGHAPEAPPEPPLPEGVHPLTLERGASPFAPWAEGGFVQMVPPVHLPQPAVGDVQSWLRLPPGGRVALVDAPDGRRVLSYPPGTVADRVETAGEGEAARVVDVRGTRIDADGRRWHHVYRSGGDPQAPLVGMEWPAGDAALASAGADAFVDALRTAGVTRHLDAVRGKLDCDGCHAVSRADNERQREHGLVNRGTDAAGWFTPGTVLADSVPVEAYGQRDPNLTDLWITLRCGDQIVEAPATGHPSCGDARVPRGTLDLAGALAAHDPHALAVCASWRALVDAGADAAPDHPCTGEALADGGIE
ncbi:MAG: hypothetical protein R3F59_04235 [Myxococcota bacterium]